MFKQIVVGVDGRQGGRDAIALAKNLLAGDGELTLAHVHAGDPHRYRSAGPAHEGERARASELLETTRTETGVQSHLRWRESASVGRGLHELCEVVDADLLVVGSSRRGLLGRILLADDTLGALNRAPCAVAIAPAGYSYEPVFMREIGVGYDGSPESERALELARKFAGEVGAKVSAFQAASPSNSPVNAVLLPLSEAVDVIVEEARDRIAALGDVEPHAVYGRPAEELAVYSASLDLLIVGRRGYGPIGRLLHRSTSRQLAHIARCPLLVLPRGARASSDQAGERGRDTAATSR
jgi:nucleotide-binding universal stress UspA family protein